MVLSTNVYTSISASEEEKEHEQEQEVNSWKKISKSKKSLAKVDFKIEISMYNGDLDAEKLDFWVDRLESYFSIGRYTHKEKIMLTCLKLNGYAMTWWKSYSKSNPWRELT